MSEAGVGDLGFDAERLEKARDVLERHVARGTTPGCVAVLLRREGMAASWAVGRHTYEADARPVRVDDIYDLASLTKIIATTTVGLSLYSEGALDLDKPVSAVIPEFAGDGREGVTVRHLMAHCSGLPAHVRFFESCHSKEEVLAAVCRTPLKYATGADSIYSDLGFILLGAILERLTDKSLEQLTQERVIGPLEMLETGYMPSSDLLPRIPPTEEEGFWRHRLIHGEVHDSNAAAMGGIAPHAGLFGKASDLARFLRAMLCGGELEGHKHFSEKDLALFAGRAEIVEGSSRALGWDTPSETGSSAGAHFSPHSFGHTGFTGTSVWADPERDLGVVLLTNRVHPSRDREGIRNLRPEFHDAVAVAMRA